VQDLWMEFDNGSLFCGLCCNTGFIDTRGVTNRGGVVGGVFGYCICTNGRQMKRKAKRPKWGGSSIVEQPPEWWRKYNGTEDTGDNQ
jgi:hypothetical protein